MTRREFVKERLHASLQCQMDLSSEEARRVAAISLLTHCFGAAGRDSDRAIDLAAEELVRAGRWLEQAKAAGTLE